MVFDEAGERTLDWDIGRVLALRAAPLGTRIALTNHRNEVWIGDVATGEAWLADRSDAGRSDDIAWSPDGLLIATRTSTAPGDLVIIDREGAIVATIEDVGTDTRSWQRLPG